MGGAASIEANTTLNAEYSALKSSGIDFLAAYKALENRIKKGKSENVGDVSIPFLAIRQLSKNLKNQESLERTKRKVLKSRSLPNNLKFKDEPANNVLEDEVLHDDLEQSDLVLIPDGDLGIIAEEKPKRKKPDLSVKVFDTPHEYEAKTVVTQSPTANGRISPSGAFHIGKIKVLETGIAKTDSFNQYYSFIDVGDRNRIFSDGASSENPSFGGKNDFIEIAALGTGASGVVSEAIHVPSLTIVALKMLPIYNQEKRRQVSRELAILCKNLAELNLLSGLNSNLSSNNPSLRKCDNILSLYNAFIDPKTGLINLVIEYMDGGSLEDLVRQGGCKDEQVLADIARQTLNGLAFLHKHKSVHRDIKPANILCSSNGIIKIADFGISKILDQTSGFANSFVGTVCYMSPERITGDSYNYSSDIWSFGLTLLAVAKGRFPISLSEYREDNKFDESDNQSSQPKIIGGPKGYWAMIQAICDDDPPVAGEDFTEKFNHFISVCLRKKAEDRYTASELLKESFVVNNIRSPRHPASIFKPGINRPAADDETVEDFHEFALSDLQVSATPSSKESEDEHSIIHAIRMEHLDRLLDKIADKLRLEDSLEDEVPLGSTSIDSTDNIFVERVENQENEHKESSIQPAITIDPAKSLLASKTGKGSVRSVHFQEDEKSDVQDLRKKVMGGGVRARLNKPLELQIPIEDEHTEDVGHQLPKPSSYFLNTGGNLGNVMISTASSSTDSREKMSSKSKAELRRLIPKMDEQGVLKWKSLAVQLNLPHQIVLLAARSKLGKLLNFSQDFD